MAGGTINLLVVEDDPFQRETICAYLAGQGFTVEGVADGRACRAAVAAGLPDAALLDVGLPGGEDGFALARWLRGQSGLLGIIMLTAAGDLVDRVVGLESGADDYITKPFEPRELLARIRAVMRRAGAEGAAQAAKPEVLAPGKARIGGAVLDLKRGLLVTAEGREDTLTEGEFTLLKLFVEHPNRALHRDWLLERTSGEEEPEAFDRAIDLRIMRLRRKVERNPTRPMAIRTVRGVGYLFDPEAV
ncbi:response regulator [Falsiroseomonas selenitidurans]|uniref:Response regulator transcription factor n=1 Tax=Falsiroseomonas selenitidurans TaxID=2716335 RepID=A0ABX1EBE5_9PROT|nr:response regulator transcription factor [Falsiroseomonas selenitidurans]NKC34123.1 response regulator transcription factor [Falsiroseomonas selenitidurans]